MSQPPDSSFDVDALARDVWGALRTGRVPQSNLLAGLPQAARMVCWKRLYEAVEPAWRYRHEMPNGHQIDPEPVLRHLGQPPIAAERLASRERICTG